MSLDWESILKNVHPCCAKTIASLGFNKPTPVQANTIPHFTKFKDVVVEACTGSGKTLAFLIPIFDKLLSLETPLASHKTGGLVIAPTRELSEQIAGVAKEFLNHTKRKLSLALITGGIRSHSQDLQLILKSGCNIVIGTPGRILHCLNVGYLQVRELEILVFDEADRLLDLGFSKQINSILHFLPKQRRTGLFSATQSKTIQQLIRVGLRNPIRIQLSIKCRNKNTFKNTLITTQKTPQSLENQYIKMREGQEMLYLLYLLHALKDKKIIIFVLTCAQVDYLRLVLSELLRNNGMNIWYMHGRLNQQIRRKRHKEFSCPTVKAGALICTDVVARGIDIADIDIIIQADPPQKIEFFIHRVGRTARMGKSGNSIVLLREHEMNYLRLLEMQKVPIAKQIGVNSLFTHRLFSESNVKCFLGEEEYIESCEEIINDEIAALTEKLQDILVSDRAVFDKAHKAFVSFIEAYNNHECKYIFSINVLNCGAIANCMGLLYLPKLKRIKMSKDAIDSFVMRTDVDFNDIKYKQKWREKERLKKLDMIKRRKLERAKNRNKKKNNNDDKFKGNDKNKKRKQRGKRKGKQLEMVNGKPVSKKQKRMSHQLREFKHYQREEVLLKLLKKNYISQQEFDLKAGYWL